MVTVSNIYLPLILIFLISNGLFIILEQMKILVCYVE